MPSRRHVLAAVGAAGLAGCVGNTGGPPAAADSSTPTASESPTTTPTQPPRSIDETIRVDGADLTLERVLTPASLPYVYTDSGGLQTNTGGRYVLAEVTTPAESPPSASSYSLVVAGRRAAAVGSRGSFWFGPERSRYPYSPGPGPDVGGSTGGWLAFPVDAELDAESPRIAISGTGWRLPGSVVARLRQPLPNYELVELGYPETIGPDEAFTVSVTVENTGPVSGTFRAVLNTSIEYASYARPIFLDVDSGEQGTWELEYGASEGLNEPGRYGGLDLRTPVGTREGTVEVTAATETATD